MSDPRDDRCGFCGSTTGDHANCRAAFDNGGTWDHYDEGYLLPPAARSETLALKAIREKAARDECAKRGHPIADGWRVCECGTVELEDARE